MQLQSIARGFALGAVGSVAGILAMRLYWQGVTALTGEDPRTLTTNGAPHVLDEISLLGKQRQEGEGSTAAVGRHAYEAIEGHAPGAEQKEQLSTGVHWAYGMLMGGLFGAARAARGRGGLGSGLAFGAALWAAGDELAVPLLGLSQGPTAYPPAQHAHRLGAHLAFGLATAAAAGALDGAAHTLGTPRKLAARSLKTYVEWKVAAPVVKRLARTALPRGGARKPIRKAIKNIRSSISI